MANTVTIPTTRDTVAQRYLLEPLGGPKDVFYYLERFPEEIYHKSPDTHLYKYMRSMLGEGGVNWLKKNYLEARILLEELGIELFDLDKFYGGPFQFGRILEENFDEDPYGLIPRDQWELIKSKSARYRNRALDFVNGARAGNTPFGMRLVAKSGLGHDVEIIENYKYLYDSHSDDPLGIEYFGKTSSTEEMVVLPRREIGISETQLIFFRGDPNAPNMGDFGIIYNGQNSSDYTYVYDDGSGSGPQTYNRIPYDGTRDHVRLALESIPQIGVGNVFVEGGPGPVAPWIITFTGLLADRDVPELQLDHTISYNNDTSNPVTAIVNTLTGGREAVDEIVNLPPRVQHSLMEAVDRVRPQTTIMTLNSAPGLRSRNNWNASLATSEYTEVIRYATGSAQVRWPALDSIHWIVDQQEREAPRVRNDLQYHYLGWHNITTISASSAALTSSGPLEANRALADYAEPLLVTSATELADGSAASFINGIYPTDYQDLPGVPPVRYKEDQFWESAVGTGDETLQLNFSFVKAVNYLSFDLNRVPLQIDIEFDAYDHESQLWVSVTPVEPYSNIMTTSADQAQNPWASIGLTFSNRKGQLVFTRSLKIRFTRQQSYTGSIKVKNLRAARNVS